MAGNSGGDNHFDWLERLVGVLEQPAFVLDRFGLATIANPALESLLGIRFKGPQWLNDLLPPPAALEVSRHCSALADQLSEISNLRLSKPLPQGYNLVNITPEEGQKRFLCILAQDSASAGKAKRKEEHVYASQGAWAEKAEAVSEVPGAFQATAPESSFYVAEQPIQQETASFVPDAPATAHAAPPQEPIAANGKEDNHAPAQQQYEAEINGTALPKGGSPKKAESFWHSNFTNEQAPADGQVPAASTLEDEKPNIPARPEAPVHSATEAEEKLKAMDEMLRIVVHDLSNPINSIQGIANYMRSRVEPGSEFEKLVDYLETAGIHAAGLIKSLLESSDLDHEPNLEIESIDINQLVQHLAITSQFRASEKQIKILSKPCDEKLMVLGDRAKLIRVLENIISNAIKFSHTEGVVTLACGHRDGYAWISVEDKGIGIPENQKEHLFNMLTRTRRTGTSGEKSYGMGMFITKKIVDLHKGSIEFESEEGRGTTFYVKLPAFSANGQ